MLNKFDKKYMAKLCDAKGIVCQACRYHNKNACETCIISNLLDKELERLQAEKVNLDPIDDIVSSVR